MLDDGGCGCGCGVWICKKIGRHYLRQFCFHIPFTQPYYILKYWCVNILTVCYTINSPGEYNEADFIIYR